MPGHAASVSGRKKWEFIYKRMMLRKKERKHAFDQEKKKGNKILAKKKRK